MKGVTIATSVRDFDRLAADRVVRQIKDKPDSVIGLSTGRTTNAMHRQVAERFVREGFDVGRVTFFGLDLTKAAEDAGYTDASYWEEEAAALYAEAVGS